MMFCTTGTIVEQLRGRGLADVDRNGVDYALRRLEVEPFGRVGFCRVFPESSVDQVETFIRSRKSRRERVPAQRLNR